MNHNLQQIQLIDTQLTRLKKIHKNRSYLGAGLTVSLHVGQLQEDEEPDFPNLSVGIFGEPEKLMELLIESLTKSRGRWLDCLRREHTEVQAYLDASSQTKVP